MSLSNDLNNNDDDNAVKIILDDTQNFNNLDCDAVKKLLGHLKHQLKTRYKYLVGEWQGAARARSTIDGKFVKNQEVIDYLK